MKDFDADLGNILDILDGSATLNDFVEDTPVDTAKDKKKKAWVAKQEPVSQEEADQRDRVIGAVEDLSPELSCDIEGRWVFVVGTEDVTKANKEELKELGLRWGRGREQWYWKPGDPIEEAYTKEQEEIDRQAILVAAAAISPDLCVELVSRWVWVSGPTLKHKDKIVGLGFRWAPNKEMYYWKPQNASGAKWGRKRDEDTMASIRTKHGSTVVQQGTTDDDSTTEDQLPS